MRIVKENLTGCVNRTTAGMPASRFLVIEEPINETGICVEFGTRKEAEEFIQRKRRKGA